MLRRVSKNAIAIILAIGVFNAGLGGVTPTQMWDFLVRSSETGIVDKIYLAQKNPNVVDNFGLGTPRAAAALDPAELEYMVDVGPVNGSTSANYVYASFFNPSGSGRTAVVKRIAVRANAVTAATYVNLTVRRTTAASAGTQIAAADIPHKNTDSSDPVLVVRHTGVTTTLAGVTDSRILGQAMPGAAGQFHSVRDITFGANDEKIILQPGEGIAVYQEAAGDADHRIRVLLEWEEVASAPSSSGEFLFAFPRVEVAATAGYVYNSFFNPASSGKTAIVKRVWFGSETCDAAAVYTNDLVLKRITAASAGTQITASNVPKKHTSSANSVMEFRRSGVTVSTVGGSDARIGHVTPCGTTGQPSGWMELNFHDSDEQFILQEGEGIALQAVNAGDVDQLIRMIVEWQEVNTASTPASQGEYIWASPRVEVAAALGTTFYTFFNPSGSGKTAVVKRLVIRNNADLGAKYSAFNFQRITAASAGTQITATDLIEKHSGSSAAAMEVRWCGAACASAITATYAGARSTASSGISDSGILKTNGPGAVGQVIGQREIIFGDNEKFVLQEGEGLGFYLNYLAGDVDHYIKILIEWDEEASAPSAGNEYLIDIGPMPGNTGTSYNYASFFNPSGSSTTAIIKRISVRIDSITTAVYIPMRVRRTTSASGGTQITAANIPKKHTGTSNSAMEIRRTGVTVGYLSGADAQIIGVETAGAVGSATAPATSGYQEYLFAQDEQIILQPGEGIALHHDTAAGDADFRVKFLIEWEEVASSSTPASEGEYLMTVGPVNGSLDANYVYASFFNPVDSGKNYSVKRVGIRANRNGTLVAPGNIAVTARGITAASAGTLISTSDVPEKHSGTSLTTAEIRHTGVTATLAGASSSRLLGTMVPGAINQNVGVYESQLAFGDDYVLQPGEGIALYQEATAGDTLTRFRFSFQWSESDADVSQSITFSISDASIGFGSLFSSSARYATGDGTGSASDSAHAHTISASTNASGGYVIFIQGNTLTCALCGGATIDAIGGSAVASSTGTEQFGIRVIVDSGTGTASSPYSGSDWAFDTSNFPDQVATGSGDESTTQYGVRYIGNITGNTESGSYNSTITYTMTGTF